MTNYLLIENAWKSFGDINLLEDITFAVNEGDKTALIARNGAGKTTLLNIIAGLDSFDAGKYYISRDVKTGYLEQDPSFDPALSLFQAVYGASGPLMETVRSYETALHLHDPGKLEKAIADMDFHTAWDLDSKIKSMLGVLKLHDSDQLVGDLSGGQVKRLALAVTLLNEPDFLILDEPTNHLDIDMIEWLEDYLSKSGITLLMVTHDRYFLDRVCHKVIEIDEKKIYTHHGNYSYYIQHRHERLLNKALNAEKARNLMRRELEWIRRMPKARTTKAKYRIDAFNDLKKESEYNRNDSEVEINVRTSRLGKKILEMNEVSKNFGETVILDRISYTYKRKEKLGIIGNNGVGKTTFLNIITGLLKPDSGTLEKGETVVYGYYRQEGMEFKKGQRVIDILKDIAEVVTLGDDKQISVSQFLTHFLFTPEMQYVPVEKLSGGEKRRLYLMTILMRNPNFLVLDEPTNDFDIVTLTVLEDFLYSFDGCLVIVSHDRFFMDKLVDHLFIFEGEGKIYDFPGNYSDFRATEREQRSKEVQNKQENERPASKKPVERKDTGTRRLSFNEKREFERLTMEIGELEQEKSRLDKEISGGGISHEDLVKKSERIGVLMAEIDRKSDRWLELSE